MGKVVRGVCGHVCVGRVGVAGTKTKATCNVWCGTATAPVCEGRV